MNWLAVALVTSYGLLNIQSARAEHWEVLGKNSVGMIVDVDTDSIARLDQNVAGLAALRSWVAKNSMNGVDITHYLKSPSIYAIAAVGGISEWIVLDCTGHFIDEWYGEQHILNGSPVDKLQAKFCGER